MTAHDAVPVSAEELAELRRDAERYRWLRQQQHIDIAACWLVSNDVEIAEDLDAAIDAAMVTP